MPEYIPFPKVTLRFPVPSDVTDDEHRDDTMRSEWSEFHGRMLVTTITPDTLAADYLALVRGWLCAAAFRMLNSGWELDSDSVASISLDLPRRAVAAAERVGVGFTEGTSKTRNILDGDLDKGWLYDLAPHLARWAVWHWNPQRAAEIQKNGHKGGASSSSKINLDLSMVDGLSKSIAAKALGVSTSTIARRRAEARKAANQ